MKKVQQGNYVKIHYTGKYQNGEIFESTQGCRPMELHVGASETLPKFENALLEMGLNEKKSFTLEPVDAYGERDDNMEQSFARSDFPDDFQPEVGQWIVVENSEQGQFMATIKDVKDGDVLLDLNHPLAGKSLSFDVEILEINDQPTESSCGCGCSCSH